MTALLFDRVAKVVITRPVEGFVGATPEFFGPGTSTIEITDLRIKFDVKKNLAKNPNPCTIFVYNLAETTRNEIERGLARITLYAGYDNSPRLLFSGDRKFAASKQDKTEWETKIEVTDGGRAFAHARMNRSYKPPIQVRQVLRDAAASMNTTLPSEIEKATQLQQSIPVGLSLVGPTRDILTQMLAPYNYGWSFQNGQLQILRDEDVRPGDLIVVSEDTGMIGSPERVSPDHKKDRSDITFEMLMYPELNPGRAVQVISRSIKGNFKIKEVVHTGDTHNKDWKSKVKAAPL